MGGKKFYQPRASRAACRTQLTPNVARQNRKQSERMDQQTHFSSARCFIHIINPTRAGQKLNIHGRE